MTHAKPSAFDAHHASRYDKAFEKLAPFKEALHILTWSSLCELPEDARILCVGAGTGAEILHLAALAPGWSFTAVDISGPMLDVCRARVEEAGHLARCSFHVGPIETLAATEPFHAATSILVSQFILDEDARRRFFREIGARLTVGGHLVTVDLAGDLDAGSRDAHGTGLAETWRGALRFNGATAADLDRVFEAYRSAVAVVPETRIAAYLEDAGFGGVTRIFQVGMMHGWRARR